MAWKGWDAPVWGGDGARQDTPAAASLFVNRSVKARRERERARDARNARKALQIKADRQRRIDKMRRGESTTKPSWW